MRMERQALKRYSFLLLEGITDIKRFERYVDQNSCSMVNCYGRDNAIGAVELLCDEGFLGPIATVDADFDRIIGTIKLHEGIVYSDKHDLDLDWLTPDILERYLLEVGDRAKYTFCGSASEIIEKIMLGLKPISVAKLLNKQGLIRYKLSEINAGKCFAGFKVDIGSYVGMIFEGHPANTIKVNELKSKIADMMHNDFDLWQLTNGHDFHCALGVSLRNELGNRTPSQTRGSEVKSHLRLANDEKDFKTTTVYAAICAWTEENSPFRILLPMVWRRSLFSRVATGTQRTAPGGLVAMDRCDERDRSAAEAAVRFSAACPPKTEFQTETLPQREKS